MLSYEETMRQLGEYGQQHLLKNVDELRDDQKEQLLKEIGTIDFEMISKCLENNATSSEEKDIEPIGILKLNEIESKKENYFNLGIQSIKEGKVGAVLLAGGQGTRLGFDKPKGTCNIGLTKDRYIFEFLIENLMDVVKKAEAWVPLFIMTSQKNNDDTISFFEEHKYFGYKKEYVFFFVQEMVPSVDYNGKIYMEEPWKISMSPNGNGGWFKSMKNSGVLSRAKDLGVEWLNVFAVDNVLQKIADPYFIGATISAGLSAGAKVVKKASPAEKVGVVCRENGRPSIVEYYELTQEMMDALDENGELAYNYGVILNYLFDVASLENNADQNMPIHIVEKKIPFINELGEYVKPESPNGYKFETLVLDMIRMYDDVLMYEVVREHEFAPIKNKDGVDSIESARKLLLENGYEL